jgi:hypothetical protein
MRFGSGSRLARAAVGAWIVLAIAMTALAARAQREAVHDDAFMAGRPPVASLPSECALSSPTSDTLDTQTCLECHAGAGGGALHGSHPTDLDYDAAEGQAGRPGALRPIDEVVRRGVLLPEGRLHCVTCHDARSPWASKIALPPGSVAVPAVNPRDPSTYEGRESWRTPDPRAPVPPAGSAVSPSPLCIACHALD